MSVLLVLAFLLTSALTEASTIELRWDPNPEPEVTGYKVYVGSTPGHYDQVFSLGRETTFSFTSAEPGQRYYFAVAAVAGSAVSEKSNEVLGIGEGGGAPGVTLPSDTDPPSSSGTWPSSDLPIPPDQTQEPWQKNPYYWGFLGRPATVAVSGVSGRTCLAAAATATCFQYAQVGPVLPDAGAVAAAGSGLVFFIEDAQRVRVIAGGALAPDAAYATDGESRLEGVVVDPQFARTQAVFVAESSPAGDGSRVLTILRTRYLAGTLAEAAAIVTGIRTTDATIAPFVIGTNGSIYVAAPLAAGSPYSKRLLAFDANGLAAATTRSGLPILADSLPKPVSLWIDESGSELTVVGQDEYGRGVVEQALLSDGVAATSYRALEGEPAAAVGARGVVTIGNSGRARAVSAGPSSSIYVTVESDSATPGSSQFAIIALQPY